MKRVILASFLVVLFFRNTLAVDEERIWLQAKINGKAAKLVFDTGATDSALTHQGATRFGLKIIPRSTNDLAPDFVGGYTEECTLRLAGTEAKTRFLVLELPEYVGADFEGLVGWWPLSDNTIKIDAVGRQISFLNDVPSRSLSWTRVRLITHSGALVLAIPHSDRTNGVLCMDTGSSDGLSLPYQVWQEWRTAHPANPITLKTIFTPSDGFLLLEETWADQITIGPLTFHDVPISQAGRAADQWNTQYEGTLGLAALKRFELIVDGKNGSVYFQPRKGRPPLYNHNRLGAVFVPAVGHTNQAVAHVIQGGPASEAGVRDGDILLQVDDVRVTSWSARWINRFSMKAGTKLRLTLSREGKVFSTTAILRQILEPSVNKKP